jgi:GNAT superfamily N-acetyltransferase
VTDERGELEIKPVPRERLTELLTMRWPDQNMFVGGRFVAPEDVEGIGAFTGERLHGMATWLVHGHIMHIVAVNAFTEMRGVGARLVDAVIAHGRAAGMALLRASISNDNLVALRFYQKRGFRVTGLNRGMFDLMRHTKPSIPLVGLDGIPMHDEFELEFHL